MDFVTALSTQFQLKPWQVQKVMELIDEGNTIPFIARYRKEAHGSLDDQALRQIADRLEYLRSLEKKKEEVARLIEESGFMTSEVSQALEKAETLSEIDDIYRVPSKKKNTCICGKSKRITAAGRLYLGTKSNNQSGTGSFDLS